MNIDTLVESFYQKASNEDLINEVLKFLMVETKARRITLTWDGIPDIPISEIPWSDVTTVEGEGADIQGPQRMQLMQFLDDIEGDDLKDKIEGLSAFYDADVSQLTAAAEGLTPKAQIAYALGYLTFFKTLTKIIAHFNASSAGFSFEAFMGVLLGGKQIATGEGTIADLTAKVGGKDVPISLKLYTEGSLKVGGSFTDLVNDIRHYGQMQYVAVTKDLDDEKQSGTLNFYRFNFTLDNLGTILLNSGIHNPDLMRLPKGFIDSPEGFEDIEIPAPPTVKELVKIYEDRVKKFGERYPADVITNAIAAVGLPEDTSMLKGQKKIFGRDELPKIRSPKLSTSLNIQLAVRMGLLPEDPPPYPGDGVRATPQREEWLETYGKRIELALDVYNNVVAAAYNDVVEATRRNIQARQELIKRGGGVYDTRGQGDDKTEGIKGFNRAETSVIAYNKLSPELKKKALLLSHGYVNTDQFEITENRVLDIADIATNKPGVSTDKVTAPDQETEEAPITEAADAGSVGVFPAGQTEVQLGSIEVGQEKVIVLLDKVSEIIDTSVFEIFEDLKSLTTNIQAYFGNGLQDDKLITAKGGAVEKTKSIGTKAAAMADDKE